jgi:endonuclease YncB( thermonuclease family)
LKEIIALWAWIEPLAVILANVEDRGNCGVAELMSVAAKLALGVPAAFLVILLLLRGPHKAGVEEVAAPTAQAALADVVGVARVVDGDTVKIGSQRVRIFGIDAPESDQTCKRLGTTYRCGDEATKALTALIEGNPLMCKATGVDRYQRVVARCYVGEVDLGGWMVRSGWAVAFTDYSTEYVGAEQSARSEHRGIWAGTFMTPKEWRRSH